MRTALFATCLTVALVTAASAADPAPAPNTLTDAEKAAGWKLLFDGTSTKGWTNFKATTIKPGWVVEDGCLEMKEGGGDIATTEEYDNFELSLDWKISPKGNSGIMYRVPPTAKMVWSESIEMQVLDNGGHPDGKNPKTSAASCYAILPPAKDVTKPVGDWNHAQVVADGKHIQHWLNGEKVLEFTIGSEDWVKGLGASKFKGNAAFGSAPKGRIALQDHHSQVWFRNIKIRPLPAADAAPAPAK